MLELFEMFDDGENVDEFLLWVLNLNLTGGPVTKILRLPNDEVLEAFSENFDSIKQIDDAIDAIADQRRKEGLDGA